MSGATTNIGTNNAPARDTALLSVKNLRTFFHTDQIDARKFQPLRRMQCHQSCRVAIFLLITVRLIFTIH